MPSRPTVLYANPKQLYLYVGGALVALVLLVLLVRGLSTIPVGPTRNTGVGRTTEDPWPQLARDLERETDLATCRRALDLVTSSLSADPEFPGLPGLSASNENALRDMFPGLDGDDLRELKTTGFTKLDPYHLAECYYLRDAARSLDVADLPPLEQARKAFAFVCRQVYLNRWIVRLDKDRVQPMPAVPPSYVLRRGWGTGLERAMVFLALLRQLGLDGCLIGPAGSESKDGQFAPPEKAGQIEALKGPFWAVGVRVGADIHLFEPWRGAAFPGPAGTPVATLANLRANPNLVDGWISDVNNPWDVKSTELAAGEVFLATPLSSLAPRMKVLEEKLTGSAAVNVYTDAAEERNNFLKDKATTQLPKWWSPGVAIDDSDVLHVTATFHPADEGGRDPGKGPSSRMTRYQASLLPATLFARAPELTSGEATNLLWGYLQGAYLNVFLSTPSPLERLQRGAYFDVATQLTRIERDFSQAVQRYRGGQELPAVVRQFVGDLNELYGKLQRARASRDTAAQSAIGAEIDGMWAKRELVGVLVERGISEPSEAEATYLLALCKHESADRASGRAERAAAAARAAAADPKADPEKLKVIRTQAAAAQVAAVNAWKEAKTWWLQYSTVRLVQQAAYPGRSAHSQLLSDEAAAKASGT